MSARPLSDAGDVSAEVCVGPWGEAPVKQSPRALHREREWWARDANGVLWVRNWGGGIYKAPVPMAVATRPINHRPPAPSRITVALDARGMYGPEVDEALGVATPDDAVVDAWETGALTPTVDEVRRLATLTFFPPHSFFRRAIPDVEQGFICGDKGCRVLGARDTDAEAT